jgi:hypothetical protein
MVLVRHRHRPSEVAEIAIDWNSLEGNGPELN